jgi:hypothetical protein
MLHAYPGPQIGHQVFVEYTNLLPKYTVTIGSKGESVAEDVAIQVRIFFVSFLSQLIVQFK